MAVLLALCAAVTFGVADYLGGRASRSVSAFAVAAWVETLLLVQFAGWVAFTADRAPSGATVAWALFAGSAGGLAGAGLYLALSSGEMSVVAPISAVTSAVLPVAVGLIEGERPGALGLVGIGLALVAILAIAAGGGAHERVGGTRRWVIGLALLVGMLFGVMYVGLAEADDGSWWPMLLMRIASAPLTAAVWWISTRRTGAGRSSTPRRAAIQVAALISVVLGVTYATYLESTRHGLLSVVVVVVSLYPASTVVLAAWLDHERPSRTQLAGMAVAVVAVALVGTA